MAGYSGTPLPKKLGIREASRLGLVHAPPDFEVTLGELPHGVLARRGLRGTVPLDVMVAFFTRRTRLEAEFPRLKRRLAIHGGLWLAWPKRASGKATDLGDGEVRRIGLAGGLVDNKVCAIDETWSGLRFVYRVADR